MIMRVKHHGAFGGRETAKHSSALLVERSAARRKKLNDINFFYECPIPDPQKEYILNPKSCMSISEGHADNTAFRFSHGTLLCTIHQCLK
jgi:hypothetical protein